MLEAAAEGQTKRIRKLLHNGADVDFRNSDDGLTALNQAVLSGFDDVVDELISAGADINATSKDFGTPLCLAACCGGDEIIVGALRTKRFPFELYSEVIAYCMAAIRCSDISTMMDSVGISNWMTCMPIHVAGFFGHDKLIRMFLSFGADVQST